MAKDEEVVVMPLWQFRGYAEAINEIRKIHRSGYNDSNQLTCLNCFPLDQNEGPCDTVKALALVVFDES